MKILNEQQIAIVTGSVKCTSDPSGMTIISTAVNECFNHFCVLNRQKGFYASEGGPMEKGLGRNSGEYHGCADQLNRMPATKILDILAADYAKRYDISL